MSVICETCGVTLSSKSSLAQHTAAIHLKKRDFVCKICNQSFFSNYKLKFHQHKHSAERNFVCEVCSKTFKTRSDLSQHKRTHFKGPQPCTECKVIFGDIKEYQKHYREVHLQKNTLSRDCKICSKTFSSHNKLQRHIKNVHEKIKNHKCTHCNKEFSESNDLKTHVNNVHLKQRNHGCIICFKSFSKSWTLMEHMKKVHANGEIITDEGLSCTICGILFAQKSSLTVHMKAHSNSTYTCDVCNATLPDKKGVLKHLCNHFPDLCEIIEEKLTCKLCGLFYTSEKNLKKHTQTVHVPKVFCCQFCSLTFSRRDRLKNHLLKCPQKNEETNNEPEVKLEIEEVLVESVIIKKEAPDSDINIQTDIKIKKEIEIEENSMDYSNDHWGSSADFSESESYQFNIDFMKSEPQDSAHDQNLKSIIKEEREEVSVQDKSCVKTYYVDGVKFHQCPDCNKSYSRLAKLDDHINFCHKKFSKHKCTECDMSFGYQTSLRRHTRGHFNKKAETTTKDTSEPIITIPRPIYISKFSHQCPICKKVFPRNNVVEDHISYVHNHVSKYKCTKCNVSFGYQTSLRRHTRKEHLEKEAEIVTKDASKPISIVNPVPVYIDEKKIHQCPICKKLFRRNNVVEDHISFVHNNICKYKCSPCDKSFGHQRSYRMHVVKYHAGKYPETEASDPTNSEKVIKCSFCDKTFSNEIELQDHISLCHKDMNYKCSDELCDENFCSKHPAVDTQDAFEKFTEYSNEPNPVYINETKAHQCKICKKVYSRNNQLQDHIDFVHKNLLKHKCPQCGKCFGHSSSLRRHKIQEHSERPAVVNVLKCNFCDKEFKYSIEKHLKVCSGGTTCNECGRKFQSSHGRYQHYISAHLMEKLFTCDYCGRKFSKINNLKTHMIGTHIKPRFGVKCRFCEETFPTIYLYKKHRKQSHATSKTRNCGFCGEVFQKYDDFKIHVETHENAFICLVCGGNFEDEIVLEDHKKIHKKFYLTTVICQVCGAELSCRSSLQVHMRIHTEENPYVCDLCGLRFKYATSFEIHKDSHITTKKHDCEDCAKAFKSKGALRQHRRVHMEKTSGFCEICNKEYAMLDVHMLKHTGKYSCSVCGRNCSSKQSLECHQAQHTGIRMYSCCYCIKSYTFAKNLKMHVRKMHQGESDFEQFFESIK